MLQLGVNVDHVCTVREARKVSKPDPVEAALLCENAGAVGVTAHLREDRRHMQDADLELLAKTVKALNMEMAATQEMVDIAMRIKPKNCCIVPEKREELTTEGGLDIVGRFQWITECTQKLNDSGIVVSLFIDPEKEQIKAAMESGAEFIELHTGTFANSIGKEQQYELERLIKASEYAHEIGLKVNAGHGIDYENIQLIKQIPHLIELNIGHSIIGRAIMVGLKQAVSEMLCLMDGYDS